jgi:hypothetical protein
MFRQHILTIRRFVPHRGKRARLAQWSLLVLLAGIAYDYNGDGVDLDSPRARTGPRNERDTRWVDEHGHSGRWEPPVSAAQQCRRRIA